MMLRAEFNCSSCDAIVASYLVKKEKEELSLLLLLLKPPQKGSFYFHFVGVD
jgi:hypothetical protein